MKRDRVQRLVSEPLLHFALIGAVIFAAYAWRNPESPAPADTPARQVHIGEGEVQWLKETWARQWQREPTPEEVRGLVTELLREQLLAREAIELGLDENDTVVRRRLAQKLEFLIQDTASLAEPTEDDLRRFFEANPERFTEPARISFAHVYFNPERRSDVSRDVAEALSLLSGAGPVDAAAMGDPLMIEGPFENMDERAVSREFGPEFSRALFALKPAVWHGPVASGYGMHAVKVSSITPSKPMAFDDVRDQVLERWRGERQREVNETYLAALLEKYDVIVDESIRPLIGNLDGGPGTTE